MFLDTRVTCGIGSVWKCADCRGCFRWVSVELYTWVEQVKLVRLVYLLFPKISIPVITLLNSVVSGIELRSSCV